VESEQLRLVHILHIAREGSKMTALCHSHIVIIQTFILHDIFKVVQHQFRNMPCEEETYNLVQCFDARTIRTKKVGKYRGKG